MQSYTYFNSMGDSDEGNGWTYTTWKWDGNNHNFFEYYTDAYTENEEYGWEAVSMSQSCGMSSNAITLHSQKSHLQKKTKELVENGMLVDETIHIGMPINDVLKKYPHRGDPIIHSLEVSLIFMMK